MISADLSTKEASPKGMPESVARLSICPGNEAFSVLLSWPSVDSGRERTQTCAKKNQKNKKHRKVSSDRGEGESKLTVNLHNTGETFFKTKTTLVLYYK